MNIKPPGKLTHLEYLTKKFSALDLRLSFKMEEEKGLSYKTGNKKANMKLN